MGASPEQQQARATEFSSDLRVALLKAPDNSSCESAHSPTTNAKRNLSIVGRNVRRLTPGGVRSSAFTLISTSMGAGVLALPFVLKQAGLVIGTMLVAIAGLLALVTMTIIMRASSRLDCKTYGKLVGACAGTWAQEAFDIVLFVYINGAMVAYFIFLGDFLTVVMNQFGAPVLFQQRWFIMLIGVGIGIPMCMPRKLSALRNVTPLSTFALLMLSFTAVVYAPQLHIDSIASGEQVQMASITWSLIPSFNICMFSFLCHNNVVPVISELVNPSDMRIMKVTASTAVGCGLFFIVIAQAGYFSFMGETGSNFLVNYPSREFLPSLCRCLFSISLTVGLVVNNHPAASAFIGFLQRCMASTIGGQADSGERSSQNANYGVARQVDLSSPEATADHGDFVDLSGSWVLVRMVVISVSFCFQAYAAYVFPNAAKVLSFLGGTLGTVISVVVPLIVFNAVLAAEHSKIVCVSVNLYLSMATMFGFVGAIIGILS